MKKYKTEEERRMAHREAVIRCMNKKKQSLVDSGEFVMPKERETYLMKFFITACTKETAMEEILKKYRSLGNIDVIVAEELVKQTGAFIAHVIIKNRIRNINHSLLYIVKSLDEELIQNVRNEVSENKRKVVFEVI